MLVRIRSLIRRSCLSLECITYRWSPDFPRPLLRLTQFDIHIQYSAMIIHEAKPNSIHRCIGLSPTHHFSPIIFAGTTELFDTPRPITPRSLGRITRLFLSSPILCYKSAFNVRVFRKILGDEEVWTPARAVPSIAFSYLGTVLSLLAF